MSNYNVEEKYNPNKQGYKLYFETIKKVVEEQIDCYEASVIRINAGTKNFPEIKIKDSHGYKGLFYDYVLGENRIEIYSNNQLIEKIEFE